MSVHLLELRDRSTSWVYDLTQEQYDARSQAGDPDVVEVGDDGRELTLREALQIASVYGGGEFDNEADQIVAALCVLRDRLTQATALPSVAILRDDREEAREMADDLAAVLDEVENRLCKGDEPDFDHMLMIGQALQRWHERTWAAP